MSVLFNQGNLQYSQAAFPISLDEYSNLDKSGFFPGQEPKNDRELNCQKPTILLVEDNDLIQLTHRKYCELFNCFVVTASDGLQALTLYHTAKPHLILLDIQLPKMSGFDVCRVIRAQEEKEKRIPIIAVTGFGDEVENECRAAGMDGYVVKPLMPDDIKNLLHKWLPDFQSIIYKVKKNKLLT